MRLRLGVFSRYRPRALTVVVFFTIAALIVLANFVRGAASPEKVVYGWPLIWHRFVYVVSDGPTVTVGWYNSGSRLAANLTIWLLKSRYTGGSRAQERGKSRTAEEFSTRDCF